MPGLFHVKIANTLAVFETHIGEANAGIRSLGGLAFHKTLLGRLPIVLTSLPSFRPCHELVMVSLHARVVLSCLLLVSGKSTLDECADGIDSFDTLREHAEQIYTTYADTGTVILLRDMRTPDEKAREVRLKCEEAERKKQKKSQSSTQPPITALDTAAEATTIPIGPPTPVADDGPDSTPSSTKTGLPHIKKGDMVYENALLFMRDALLTREFEDAIKSGNSGRVILVLKLWRLAFRGNGRTKYAHEMSHLIQNLVNVWPKPFRQGTLLTLRIIIPNIYARDIIIKNWLINPAGKKSRFIEVDLLQVHLSYWIKVGR